MKSTKINLKKTSRFATCAVLAAAILFAPMSAMAGPRDYHHQRHQPNYRPQTHRPAQRHQPAQYHHRPAPSRAHAHGHSPSKQYRQDRKIAAATFGTVAAIGVLAAIFAD